MAYLRTTRQNRFALTPYEEKIVELRGRRDREAKEFQNVTEAKEQAVRDLNEFRERKSALVKEIQKLAKDKVEEANSLELLIERQNKLIASSTREIQKAESRVKELTDSVSVWEAKLADLEKVFKELEGFLKKEQEARERYVQVKSDLAEAEKLYASVNKKIEQEKTELDSKQTQLDHYHEYLKEMSGKMTTRLQVVKAVNDGVYEDLAAGRIPLRFEIPQDQLTTVPF